MVGGTIKHFNRFFCIFLLALLFVSPALATIDDTDNDGLSDQEEIWWATDPDNVDSDGDGVLDGDEVTRILSGDRSFGTPFVKSNVWNNLAVDGDRDGVPDLAETYILGISPDMLSTDGDKYDDGQELFGISPNGLLPGYVTSPGNDVFVAAYPDISIDISDSISLVNIEEITFEERTSEVSTQGYSTSNTQGYMTSMGSSETHTESNWIDVSNKEADSTTESNYHESITNTEANYFKGYTEGKTTEIEAGSTLTSTVGATVGAEYSITGPSVSAEVSTEVTNELTAHMKNTVETSSTTNEYQGVSTSVKNSGETVNTRVRETAVSSGSGEESSYSTSITRTEYHETTVTTSNSIATGQEWATATTTNTGHAADLIFTYFIENSGTDIALEVDDIVFNIFIGHEEVPITYYASQDMVNPINNLKPGSNIQFSNTQGTVPLSLQQLKMIDEGAPIRIVLASYSYGIDELSYENAWGRGVLVELDDGVSDGDETLDTYMVPVWGEDKYADVINRAVPVVVENEDILSINNQLIDEWSWWDIFLQKSTLETKFVDESSYAKTRVYLRYNQDTDHDYYTDRTELSIGTDPDDIDSHPQPVISAAAMLGTDGENTTLTLKLSNSGNFDAYGIEARLISPDDTTTVIKEIAGGGGRLKAGQAITLENNMLKFTNITSDYTKPLILISYNEPQGSYSFLTPVEIEGLDEDVDQYADQMIFEPKLSIDADSDYNYNSSNPMTVHFNNPSNVSIEDAHLYIAYQTLNGQLLNSSEMIVDLQPGDNSFIDWWRPADYLHSEIIDDKVKIVAVLADYQNILIDEDVHKMKIVELPGLPEIIVTPNHWNFGTVEQGDLTTKAFTISNIGKTPLQISITSYDNISFLGLPALSKNLTNLVIISPGSSADFTALISTAYPGLINNSIEILTNDPEYPSYQIQVNGEITPSSDYENNVQVINEPNYIWWSKVHVIGEYSKGTNVSFNHSIETDSELVIPVAVYGLEGNKLGVGNKINDTYFIISKNETTNLIQFTIPNDIDRDEHYWIQFGKEINWEADNGGMESIFVDINNLTDVDSANIVLSSKNIESNCRDEVFYISDYPSHLWNDYDPEIHPRTYSSSKPSFYWNPYQDHSLPTYTNISVNNGTWYRYNPNSRNFGSGSGPSTGLDFQFFDGFGSWHTVLVSAATHSNADVGDTIPVWNVTLPKEYFMPLKTYKLAIYNPGYEYSLTLNDYSPVSHSIIIDFDYSHGRILNPSLSLNEEVLWNFTGEFGDQSIDLKNNLSNGLNELEFSSDRGGVMYVSFEGIPTLDSNVFGEMDLSVTSGGIVVPSDLKEGQAVSIEAYIDFSRNTSASDFIVSFYDGDPSTNGTLIGNNLITETPDGNGSVVAECMWDTTGKEGAYEIFVKVDPSNKVIETSESNNIAYRTVFVNAKSDLLTEEILFSPEKPTDGESTDISTLIENRGGNSSSFNICFYDGTPEDDNIIDKRALLSLDAGSNTTVSIPWTASTGYHDIYVTVDSDNQIVESNESNNIASKPIFVSVDEIYIDNGNISSDIAYDPVSGYGHLDGLNYAGWGSSSAESIRTDIDGVIQYRFDNLAPEKIYHLDMNFFEDDGQDRIEEIWIDGVDSGITTAINDSPYWTSVNIPEDCYEDNSVVVSIKRSGSGDAVVSEMRLREIEKVTIDCGSDSDMLYDGSGSYGYLNGYALTSWGTEVHETVRYTLGEDIRYLFDGLDASKDYQFNVLFFEDDDQDRIEEILIDGVKAGSTVDLSDGHQHLVIVEVPNSAYVSDGTVELGIRNIGSGYTVVSAITLEENTVNDFNRKLPVISLVSPANEAFVSNNEVNVFFAVTGDTSNVNYVDMSLDGSVPLNVSGNMITLSGVEEGTHQLELWLVDTDDDSMSHQGSYLESTFIVDTLAPVITVDPVISPTNSTVQTVSGTFVETGSGLASITVNGIDATLDASTYSASIDLVEGDNTISILAIDNAGNVNTTSTSIYLEDTNSEKISVASATLPNGVLTPITVSVEDVVNLTGVSFDLLYDSGIVNLEDIIVNASFVGSSITTNLDEEGKATVVITGGDLLTSSDITPVADIIFNATGDFGTSTTLELANVEFSNDIYAVYSPEMIVNGSITVGIKGDFNNNGRVDIGDVSKVAFMVAGKVPEDLNADFNSNGRVDIGDASKIAFYLAGKVSEL